MTHKPLAISFKYGLGAKFLGENFCTIYGDLVT